MDEIFVGHAEIETQLKSKPERGNEACGIHSQQIRLAKEFREKSGHGVVQKSGLNVVQSVGQQKRRIHDWQLDCGSTV